MLTVTQKKFLDSLGPEKLNRVVIVEPWEPAGLSLANNLVDEIQNIVPELEVVLMGSVYFKIAGEKDIDITIYCSKPEQVNYVEKLERFLGKHTSEGKGHTGWELKKDGYNITVYLSDPRSPNSQVQKQLFELLQTRPDLVKEYEQIKLLANGKTYREYQTNKYEFFNKVLNIT